MINNSKYGMKYEAFNGINNNNIDKYISTVKYSTNNINNISFDNMQTVFKDYQNLYIASNKSFKTLVNDEIDGIKYFQNGNLIAIPSPLYTVLDTDESKNYQCLMSFYNLNKDNIWGYDIPTTIEKLPTITASKLTIVEKKYEANMNLSVLFENLPQSLYDNVVIEEQGIMYDIDKKKYFTQTMNQEELFERIETIAMNGFSEPLEMSISLEGLIPLNMSQVDFLIALYLNLPSIPVAFISSSSINEYFIKRIENRKEINYSSYVIKHIDNNFNKEELQKLFEPYFIIN